MTNDFDRIHQDLGEIRRRARSIENGAVHKNDLAQHAREIVETADRVVRLVEDLQRSIKRAQRET